MLSIVATPIGHKDDITLRALSTLRDTTVIFCENTQTIKKLLWLHNIDYRDKKFVKFTSHDLNYKNKFVEIMQTSNVCMVSEAGTPWLSDPGKMLIVRANENQIPYTILPWATALIPAVIGANFPTTQWQFYGFLPHKKWRETILKKIIAWSHAAFFYESVHRIDKLINQLKMLDFTGTISIARELSKTFEQYYTGSLDDIQRALQNNTIPLKGEFVIGIYPKKVESFIDDNYNERD